MGGTLSKLVEVERTLSLGQVKLAKATEGNVSASVCEELFGTYRELGDVLHKVRTALAVAREELRAERTPAA